MSEIYAPGSIVGPQGPAGAAGSAAAITTLASSVFPSFVGKNLYDASRGLLASQVNVADGSVTVGGQPTNLSPMMFCPGATSMIANGTINANDWGGGICLYDANGTFISAIQPAVMTNNEIVAYTAFALPGTQAYVRWGHVPSWDSMAETAMMCFATITGTATIPGTYQPAGVALDTAADVNTKDAAVLASAEAAIAAMATNIGGSLGLFAHTMLPAPDGGLRNAVDASKSIANTIINSDGSEATSAGWSSELVFAPGATQFITNLPIRCQGIATGITAEICTFDAFGNFLAVVGSTAPNSIAGLIVPGQVYALPGNQTYVGFTWNRGNYGWGPAPNGTYFAKTDANALFIAGNATNPCPTTLPEGAPITGAPLPTIKTATQLGADAAGNMDCSTLLNAFLATASATNPIELILDGQFVTSGLAVAAAGYTTIRGIGWGSSLTLLAGSNKNVITIGTGSVGDYSVFGTNTATLPARTCSNVTLSNFTLDGNGANNSNSNGAGFVNTTNIIVEDMNFKTASWFATIFSNCGFIKSHNCHFISTGTTRDGLHYCGPCEDINVDSCYFQTGDDAIAINCPEGFGGDITRVAVTNCVFDMSLTVMRIYTSIDAAHMPGGNNVHHASKIVVSNCTGITSSGTFTLGISQGPNSTTDVDQIRDFSVSNCTFSSPLGLTAITVSMGSFSLRGVKFIPFAESYFPNNPGTAPIINIWGGDAVGELLVDDFTILRNPEGNSVPAAFISTNSGSFFGRMILRNIRVVDEAGTSYGAVPAMLDLNGTVAMLRLDELDMTKFTALASSAGWGNVTALRGDGPIQANVQTPDSVMDNGSLYLSSNASGAPSIKVGGTAKRLTLA